MSLEYNQVGFLNLPGIIYIGETERNQTNKCFPLKTFDVTFLSFSLFVFSMLLCAYLFVPCFLSLQSSFLHMIICYLSFSILSFLSFFLPQLSLLASEPLVCIKDLLFKNNPPFPGMFFLSHLLCILNIPKYIMFVTQLFDLTLSCIFLSKTSN